MNVQATVTKHQLLESARAKGHDFLTPPYFDVLVSRGLFPKKRDSATTGKPGNPPGLWYASDLLQLLDLCSLHEENSRQEAIRYGLWLRRHEVAGAREALLRKIVELTELLVGHGALDLLERRPPSESIYEELSRVVSESHALHELTYGHRPELEDQDLPALQAKWEVGENEILQLPFPVTVGGELRYPTQKVRPEAIRSFHLHSVSTPLLSKLELIDPPTDGWSLPRIYGAVRDASEDALLNARDFSFIEFVGIVELFSSALAANHLVYKGLEPETLRAYDGNLRHLFSSPVFFPATTLMIASNVAERKGVNGSRNEGLISNGLYRLSKARGSRPKKREAVLTMLFAFAFPIDRMN